MFSSSARRVACTAPSIPTTSSVPRAAVSQALSYRSHQRRYSSSKPSSPADGSKRVAEAETPASVKNKKKAAGGKSKDESVQNQNYPSVPSTQHIAAGQISASDFFSLYRPISLTNHFPKAVTEEAFASIFTPRTRSNSPKDVISTISRTVENLDIITGNMRQLKVSSQNYQDNDADALHSAITAESRKQDAVHLDSSPEDASMVFPRHILSGKYQPFNPPPAPRPMNTPESLAAGAEAAAQVQAPEPVETRTYTTVLTISESTDETGATTFHAHATPLLAQSQRFLARMQARQEHYRLQRAADMYAISVKRQRKLKMKKHKYKKLMRRTRNLRRRLDRN